MKQTRVILTIAILVLINSTEVKATVTYDDGGVHTINSDINSDVYVYNGPADDPTTVTVVPEPATVLIGWFGWIGIEEKTSVLKVPHEIITKGQFTLLIS